MPAISEQEYTTSLKDSADVVSWLSSKVSELTTGEGDRWKITRFQKTPLMSTYLVAFANGPFVHLEDSYKSPLSGIVRPLRIYTTPDLIHQAHFGLKIKKKVVPLYEQLFDIEYPLPKLDTLAVSVLRRFFQLMISYLRSIRRSLILTQVQPNIAMFHLINAD